MEGVYGWLAEAVVARVTMLLWLDLSQQAAWRIGARSGGGARLGASLWDAHDAELVRGPRFSQATISQ
jgi:hypothetical protein